MTNYTTLSGAQFARQVGADPETWAARFLDAVTEVPTTLSRVERIAFIAAWFRDAMAAAVKAAHGGGESEDVTKARHAYLASYLDAKSSE